MALPLSYAGYVTQISTMAVVSATDPAFQTILPSMIQYAESRIQADLDMLATIKPVSTYALTSGNRSLAITQGQFETIQQVNVITPAGTTDPNAGTRNATLPVTKEYLDSVWNSSSGAAVPAQFALLDDHTFLFGPWPDANYQVEIVGTYIPTSLWTLGQFDSTSTTYISTYLPEMMIMASMVYVSAYQRNFGRINDDPQMAITYEGQYQTLLKSEAVTYFRQKFQSSGWTSMTPAVVATPSRG